MQVAASPRQTGLRRSLGTLDAAALVVSNVIGVGIFTAPGVVARMAPRPAIMLSLWVAGGLLAIAGALAYADLATLHPYAGGEYVYLHKAFGPLAGFLSGWTSFIAGFSGAIAAGAVGLATYLGAFVPRWGSTQPLLTLSFAGFHWELAYRSLVALSLIFLLSLVHVRGLGPGRTVQKILAALNVLTLVALIAAGYLSPKGWHPQSGYGKFHWTGALLALVPIMFTYSGWNAAAYMAEEIRNPARNIRRALVWGAAIVTALYLGLNLLYVHALGPRLSGAVDAGSATAAVLFGPRFAHFMTLLIILALAGSVSAMIVAGPRVYFAMSRDGVFMGATARVHPRYHTPAVAILAQAVWSGVLVVSGTFEQLLIYTGMAIVLFSGLAVVALFVLRRRARVSGQAGVVGPALFIAASLAMVVFGVVDRPGDSAVGLALIAAGIPLYVWFKKKSGAART